MNLVSPCSLVDDMPGRSRRSHACSASSGRPRAIARGGAGTGLRSAGLRSRSIADDLGEAWVAPQRVEILVGSCKLEQRLAFMDGVSKVLERRVDLAETRFCAGEVVDQHLVALVAADLLLEASLRLDDLAATEEREDL